MLTACNVFQACYDFIFLLKNILIFLQDTVEYRRKMRLLKVRMLDNSLKSIIVDDSQTVKNLMVLICTKIGITNYDEYSLVWEKPEEDIENTQTINRFGTLGGTMTLKGLLHAFTV